MINNLASLLLLLLILPSLFLVFSRCISWPLLLKILNLDYPELSQGEGWGGMWWGEQEAGDVSFNPNVALTHHLTPGKSLYFTEPQCLRIRDWTRSDLLIQCQVLLWMD